MKLRWFAFVLVLLVACTAHAQDFEAGQGFLPYQSYDEGDFYAVNVANGDLVLHVPLVSYPQLGDLPDLAIDVTYANLGFSYSGYNDIYGEWWGQWNWNYSTPSAGAYGPDWAANGVSEVVALDSFWPEFAVVDGTGAQHLMGYLNPPPTSGGQPWMLKALDGSGWGTEVSSYSEYGSIWPVDTGGYVVNRNGVKTYCSGGDGGVDGGGDPEGGYSGTICDANGNNITWAFSNPYSATYTDSIGRTVPVCNLGGCGDSGTVDYPGPNGTTVPIQFNYGWFYISSDDLEYVSEADDYGAFADYDTQFDEYEGLLQSIVLPNGASWTFNYDTWGDLTSVTTPTGGTVSFSYALSAYPVAGAWGQTFSVTQRSIDANDGTPAKTWNYNVSYGAGFSTATNVVTDPDGNVVPPSKTGHLI